VSGSSWGKSANPAALPPVEWFSGRCFGLMPICKTSLRFRQKVAEQQTAKRQHSS
jgi:hypothetical protein